MEANANEPGNDYFISSFDGDGQETYVVLFFSPTCPICERSVVVLNKLISEFEDEVSFYLVFPAKYYKKREIKSFVKVNELGGILLIDRKMQVAQNYGAKVTPQAFLIDSSFEKLYSGKIDDKYNSLGINTQVNKAYLKEAISAHLNNEEINIAETNPIGCIIEY